MKKNRQVLLFLGLLISISPAVAKRYACNGMINRIDYTECPTWRKSDAQRALFPWLQVVQTKILEQEGYKEFHDKLDESIWFSFLLGKHDEIIDLKLISSTKSAASAPSSVKFIAKCSPLPHPLNNLPYEKRMIIRLANSSEPPMVFFEPSKNWVPPARAR